MKNPLPVTLWLLDQDAHDGLLDQRGFATKDHPQLDGAVYSRERFHVHPAGCWLIEEATQLVYSVVSKRFYRTPLGAAPDQVPPEAEKVPMEEAFERFYPFLRGHEEWVVDTYGPDYRTRQLSKLPPSARRYAKNWKLHFSDVLRRQPARSR